ncbi:MAG: YicC/YloC family endoribonuclease [Candidatus Heritagella sp.]
MTGYGRAEETVRGHHVTVEIKSVNHRYFEFGCRTPRGYAFLDDKIKTYLQSRLSRGKVDVYVSVETLEDAPVEVLVNHSLAEGYVKALQEISERYALRNDLTAMGLSRYPDLFSVHKTPENEEEIWSAVSQVLAAATDRFLEMRRQEGERMKADVLGRAARIMELVTEIEQRSPESVSEYEKKLRQKIQEMLGDTQVDEQRLLTETAIFADKVAVAEETVRLRSHFEQMKAMLSSDEAVGRKLDFLVQEMNREANTIGSKCCDASIAYKVVDIKAEIEKIREQIQNIE